MTTVVPAGISAPLLPTVGSLTVAVNLSPASALAAQTFALVVIPTWVPAPITPFDGAGAGAGADWTGAGAGSRGVRAPGAGGFSRRGVGFGRGVLTLGGSGRGVGAAGGRSGGGIGADRRIVEHHRPRARALRHGEVLRQRRIRGRRRLAVATATSQQQGGSRQEEATGEGREGRHGG
jgi:hypothetical protein